MPKKPAKTQEELVTENQDLRARLDEAEETLRAIRSGEVDALVVPGAGGEQIFTLKGADRSYRVLIEDMSEGALTLTAEGVILYANRHFAEMLKTPLEKVIGSTIYTWFTPDRQRILQSLLRKGGDEKRREELVLTASDGTQVPVYLSANLLLMDEMPDSFCLVATDLTERNEGIVAAEKSARASLEQSERSRRVLLSMLEDEKQAENALAVSEAELRALFASMRDIVLVIDREGIYREIAPTNPAAWLIPPQELLGKRLQDVFPAEQSEVLYGAVQQVLDTKQTMQIEYELIIGNQSVWYHASISPASVDSTLWVARDITDRKRAEEALRKKDEHHRNVVESIFRFVPEGLLVFTENSSLVKQNKAFEEITQQYAARLGYTEQELAELITDQVRSRLLSGDTTEIHIPEKRG